MQVFGVESLYCRENATKKSASADLSVILIYCLFLFLSRKEQVSLKLVSFLHTNNHNKSTTLVDCASNL